MASQNSEIHHELNDLRQNLLFIRHEMKCMRHETRTSPAEASHVLESIRKGVNSLREDFSSLRKDVNSLRNDVNSLRDVREVDRNTVQKEVESMRNEAKINREHALKGVESICKEVDSLREHVNSMSADAKLDRETAQKGVESIREQLNVMRDEAKVDRQNPLTRLESIRDEVSFLREDLNRMREDMDLLHGDVLNVHEAVELDQENAREKRFEMTKQLQNIENSNRRLEWSCHELTQQTLGGSTNECELPDKIIRMVMSHLSERELCRLAQTSKRFNEIANEPEHWKRLYRDVYEYELPLMVQADSKQFTFIQTDPQSESHAQPSSSEKSTFVYPGLQIEPWISGNHGNREMKANSSWSSLDDAAHVENPWKESFRQLYRAFHVRPRFALKARQKGRTISFFETIEEALYKSSLLSEGSALPIVLVHAGTHVVKRFHINTPTIVLGCGPGRNPAENVIIKTASFDGGIVFDRLNSPSYLGYLTFYNVAKTSEMKLPRSGNEAFCCLIEENAIPVIDHCIFRSSVGNGVMVADSATPLIRKCDISNCKGAGLFITDQAKGLYDDNRIVKNEHAGILIDKNAQPVVLDNNLQDCRIIRMNTADEGETSQRK